MKRLICLMILAITQVHASGQSCLPDGIVFESQSQIDNFQADYPGCTVIEGDVTIGLPGGSDISSLAGLSILEVITGQLLISQNHNLTDLAGFDNLTMIMSAVYINDNQSLESLAGLENLILIGGMFALTNNNSLASLDGLDNLASIDQDLLIQSNSQLGNLSALRKLVNLGGNLQIEGNPVLSTCEAHGICVYLSNSPGSVIIANNASGCNSQAEVETACANSSVSDHIFTESVKLIHDGSRDTYTLIFLMTGPGNVDLTVCNIFGQQLVQIHKDFPSQGFQEVSWTMADFPAGIYVYRLEVGSAQSVVSSQQSAVSGKFLIN